jgi:DNA repair ATPase RecN
MVKMTDAEQDLQVQLLEKDYEKKIKEHKIITQVLRKIMVMPDQDSKFDELVKRSDRLKEQMDSLGLQLDGAREVKCARLRAELSAPCH